MRFITSAARPLSAALMLASSVLLAACVEDGDSGSDGAMGEQGVPGPQGPEGPQGPVGPAGPQGAQGPQGPAGLPGAPGAQGTQGTAGPAGPAGSTGSTGSPGSTGARGPAGEQGPAGEPGEAGPAGPQGPIGPQGPAGTGGITLPFSATQSEANPLFSLTNTGNGSAIRGVGNAGFGLHGITSQQSSGGVIGDNNGGGEAIVGRTTSNIAGAVVGRNDGGGYGVHGFIGSDTSGKGVGVYGRIGVGGSTGRAGRFENFNALNPSNAFEVETNGGGNLSDNSLGNAASFLVDNANSVGAAVRGEVTTQLSNFGAAGIFGVASGSAGVAGLFHVTDANGAGLVLVARNQGLGQTARFTSLNAANNNAVIYAETLGNNDLAVFRKGAANVARIDSTGVGFFNGGVQTSGADLAELIPTVGEEPQIGDVVEIDPLHEDRFRLSSSANSTRVAGVISTQPGVTLNAPNGAHEDAAGPALALVGRVPVKVTRENGPIRIGDLLVASSKAGHAMRAPEHPAPGTVIGKALKRFDEPVGHVEMLVMLR